VEVAGMSGPPPHPAAPANIPLAAGGPPIVTTRMMKARAEISRELGYPDGKVVAWWRVLEQLLDARDRARSTP
jgi:hypothetical protein